MSVVQNKEERERENKRQLKSVSERRNCVDWYGVLSVVSLNMEIVSSPSVIMDQ